MKVLQREGGGGYSGEYGTATESHLNERGGGRYLSIEMLLSLLLLDFEREARAQNTLQSQNRTSKRLQ